MTQHKHLFLDILIGLLLALVLVLINYFIISLKSQPADYKWQQEASEEGSSSAKATEDKERMVNVQPGERVFLPILNFHHIEKAPDNLSKVDQSFFIEPDKFEQILQDLEAEGYQFYFMSELVHDLKNGQMPAGKPLALTFDDGNEDFYTNAFPILQKYNIKSSMYIMTGVKGSHWLSADQILELDATGLVEFGSHTIFHPFLAKVDTQRQIHEIVDSKKYLENLLHKPIDVLCYPFGSYNAQIEQETKDAGYLAGLTFDQDAWQKSDNLFALTRISVYPGLDVVKFLEKLKLEK